MTALATRSGWRSGRPRVPTKRLRIIARLRAEGMSNCEIAWRMGVTEKAIRKQVGPSEQSTQQHSLPLDTQNSSATACPISMAEPMESAPSSPMGQALSWVSRNKKHRLLFRPTKS